MAGFTFNGFFQVVSQYSDADNQIAMAPYVFPPFAGNIAAYGDLTLRISYINGKNLTTLPANAKFNITASTSNTDFLLSWAAGQPTIEGKIVAVVTIKATNLWRTSKTARQQLRNSLTNFAQALEDMEINGNGLAPGGAAVIMQRTIEALPSSLDELLSFRYNFNTANRYIDLQAGMRLSVDYSAYQFVSPISPGVELNGFVGTGTSIYNVNRYLDANGIQRLSFNSFLGASSPLNIDFNPAISPTIASSIIDLQAAGCARRYYRLCYPSQMPNSSSTGNTGISQNILLIGADTLADLEKATNTYLTSGRTDTASAAQQPIIYTFFRGRTIVTPEIQINLNGQFIYVPVGTTVRNLIDNFFNWNFVVRTVSPSGTSVPVNSLDAATLRLFRQWTPNAATTKYIECKLMTLTTDTYPTGMDVYDLPLIKGDSLIFGTNFKPN